MLIYLFVNEDVLLVEKDDMNTLLDKFYTFSPKFNEL